MSLAEAMQGSPPKPAAYVLLSSSGTYRYKGSTRNLVERIKQALHGCAFFGLSPKDGGKGEFLLTTHHNYSQPVIREILESIRPALDQFHLPLEEIC